MPLSLYSPLTFARLLWVLFGSLLFATSTQCQGQVPNWNWTRALDAGNDEDVRDVAIEPLTGNIYAVGSYRASSATANSYGLPASVGGSSDAFITKFDPNGNLLWSRAIGSNQDDAATGVAVASSGLVVITGNYGGNLSGFGLNNGGSSDAFIIAYDGTGAYQWAKRIGGVQKDEGTGIAISGNTIVAFGTFTNTPLLAGLLSLVGLTNGRSYAYLNAYNLAGSQQWSLTGSSNDDIITKRIATDDSNVYVVGNTGGSTMSWLNSLGTSLVNANTTNVNALFVSAVSLSGTPVWVRMIDNPGDPEAACNGVAVHCRGVYVTGNSHNGSVFPGGISRTIPGVHDYFFIASLSTATGTTQWVRIASSSSSHGAIGHDVSVGRNGQIHMAGTLAGTVTTDGGTTINGGSDEDLCIARFNSDGTAVWYDREPSNGDERAMAIATMGSGNVIVGGWYEDGLTVGANIHPGTSGTNMFTASFTDPYWSNLSNNPARFSQPEPVCMGSAPIDLNANLVAYADSSIASSNVSSPQNAVGAPNGIGADYSTVSGWQVLDLKDTLFTGEAVTITWRSQIAGSEARMLVSSSIDGITWSAPTTYSTTSASYITTNYPISANARFIKTIRHSSGLYVAFQVDAVRFLGTTQTGGTWSGGPYVTAAGMFTPPGVGSFPVTYTVVAGGCTYTQSQSIEVRPVPIGGTITGGGIHCPGTSGILTLSGYTGTSLRWQRSGDGNTWSTMSETSSTLAWGGFTGTIHFRVLVFGGSCGVDTSTVATVIVKDTVPPTATCPPPLTTLYVPTSGCTVAYTIPDIASTDNCHTPVPGGIRIVTNGHVQAADGTAITIDADLSLSGGTDLLLGPGIHAFTDTIADQSGNFSVCTWQVQVLDAIAPVVTCPATIELPAGVSCKAEVPDVSGMAMVATDNCTDPPILGQDVSIGSYVQAGDIIHITATDASGNVAQCPMTVVVIDNDPPVFDNCPGPLTVTTDPNSCEHIYTLPTLESTDECDGDTESNHRTLVLEAGNTLWQDVTGGSEHVFPPGLHRLMEVHRDDSGNQDTCVWSLNVLDGNAPSIVCPAIIAQLNAGVGCTVVLPNYTTGATVTGNCSGNAGVVVTQSPAAGTMLGSGTHTITLTATQNGSSATCSFGVMAVDNIAPNAMCASTTVTLNGTSATGIDVALVNAGSTDNCTAPGALGLSVTPSSVSCADIGHWLIYKNNFDQHISNCTPTDEQTAAGFLNVSLQGANGGALNEYWSFPSASPDRCLTSYRTAIGNTIRWQIELTNTTSKTITGLTIGYDLEVPYVRFDNTSLRSAQLHWYVDPDAAGPSPFGSALASSPLLNNAQVVNASLTQKWLTDAEMDVLGLSARGLSHTIPVSIAPGQSIRLAFGRVAGGAADERHMNFGVDNLSILAGTNSNLTLVVTDQASNTASCTSALTVLDGTPPTITCPANRIVGTNAQCTATAISLGTPISNDACGIYSVTNNAPVWFPVGSHTVTWTATDMSGNIATCGQIIQVIDTVPPTITCPQDTTFEVYSGNCSVEYLYELPTIHDNCGGPWSALFVSGLPPGEFPIGLTTVNYSGNVGGTSLTCEFDVNVLDRAPPSVYCPLYDSLQLFLTSDCQLSWPDLIDSITVYDCSATTGVMWPPADTVITQPGVYAMTMDFSDAYGNHTDNDHLIWVRDTIRPTFNACPSNQTVPTISGACYGITTWNAPVVMDNCGGASISQIAGPASNSYLTLGEHIVTYLASDASGNQRTCSFTLTVVDNEAPDITCPNDLVITAPPGACSGNVNLPGPVLVDENCTAGAWTTSANDGLWPLGDSTVTYTVSDGTNSSSCNFEVSVQPVSVDLSYSVTSICQGSAPILPSVVTPAGGVFSDANQSGTTNPVTGAFDPSLATPGLHTLGYVFAGDCTSHDWFTVNVVAAPNAAITYADSPVCSNESLSTISRTGTAGGIYTATPSLGGLSSTTGHVDLTVASPGTYTVTYSIPASGVCPAFNTSTVLTITQSSGNTATANACDSYTWPVNGQTYTASGTYYHTVGCNSDTLNLTITPNTTNTTVASACGSYTWSINGQTYNASGTYSHVVGCNTEVLDLTITPATGSSATASACGSYDWFGTTYTTSGTYYHTVGCNSDTLNLTITPATGNSETASACGSYDWFGTTYTASGTYYHSVGCNSDTLNLTITPNTINTTVASACGNYTWSINGQTYNASGSYTHVVGCNTEVLDLTITPATGSAETASACGSYDWFGNTYTATGTYYHTVGCNSDTLNLTITPNTTNTTVASACGSYTWSINGQTYNASGTYTHVVGCNTEVLDLTITPTTGGTTTATACGSYDWFGTTYTASGTYYHTVGCNSDTLELTIPLVPIPDASWNPPSVICSSNDFLDLSTLITGNTGGTWNGQNVVNGVLDLAGSGEFLVTYVVSNGVCSAEESHTITIAETPIANAGPDISVCGSSGSTSAVPSIGTGMWTLPTGLTPYGFLSEPGLEVHAVELGSYQLIWTVNNGSCSASDTMTLMFIDTDQDLNVDAGPDQALDVVSSTQLQGSVDPGGLVSWSVVGGSAVIVNSNAADTWVTSLASGYNTLVLTATWGQCVSVSDTVMIHVSEFFIPEGFSPNGDGVNDVWEITGIEAFPGSTLKVFNRWGQLVYDSPNYSNQWDGRSNNGLALPDDTYFHVLNLGGDRTYNGHVILKR